MRAARWASAIALWIAAAGCMPTASVAWSPDGRRAVYGTVASDDGRTCVRWSVLDADGRPIGDVDGHGMQFLPWYGGFVPVAWSADSRSLYFTRRDAPGRPAVLCRWVDGRSQPVASLGVPDDVLMLRAAPDGQWVAILCGPPGTIEKTAGSGSGDNSSPPIRLLAIHLPDGAVRQLTDAAGMGACFTGPNRLAFVRADLDAGRPIGTGQLVEVNLSDPQPATEPVALADVLLGNTGELEAVPDGLLFLAGPRSYPAVPPVGPPGSESQGFTLFHWTRTTGRLAPVAERLLYFTPSPDGTRAITIGSVAATAATTAPVGDARLRVCLQPLDGSDAQPLRDLPGEKLAVLPVWHGNDRVTMQSSVGVDRENGGSTATVFDLVEPPRADQRAAGRAADAQPRVARRDAADLRSRQLAQSDHGSSIAAHTIPTMKIYTKAGDDGTTGLIGGGRVRKSDARLDAYGTVDELNAHLGLAAAVADAPLVDPLHRVMDELFVVGSHLAAPAGKRDALPKLDGAMAARLEAEIDAAEAALPPLRQFVLPGGCELAARLHVARTVCRRAERLTVLLPPPDVEPALSAYVNRLSDWLFVQARAANGRAGVADVPWRKA